MKRIREYYASIPEYKYTYFGSNVSCSHGSAVFTWTPFDYEESKRDQVVEGSLFSQSELLDLIREDEGRNPEKHAEKG